MKSPNMSANEFRVELKRLELNQSSFAVAAEVPLRTVQSWALGERRIPLTARMIIEKVERMSTKDKIIAIAQTLPEKKLKVLRDVVKAVSNQAKEMNTLRDEVQELRGTVSKNEAELHRLRETCVFQANKLATYAREFERRVASVVAFNN